MWSVSAFRLLLELVEPEPLVQQEMVERQVLQARMNEGLMQREGFSRKITLLSAPAGYGKTSLAVEWLRSSGKIA